MILKPAKCIIFDLNSGFATIYDRIHDAHSGGKQGPDKKFRRLDLTYVKNLILLFGIAGKFGQFNFPVNKKIELTRRQEK